MNNFFKWLVLSSENPKEVALTIQGVLVAAVPGAVMFLDQMGVKVLQNNIVDVIVIAVSAVGLLLTVVGLIRKLINTFGPQDIVVFKAKKKGK